MAINLPESDSFLVRAKLSMYTIFGLFPNRNYTIQAQTQQLTAETMYAAKATQTQIPGPLHKI
jgi:hypothetical protein